MRSNAGARFLMIAGFLACSLAFSAWIVTRTALDADATERAARSLLNTDAIRDEVREQLRTQVAAALDRANTDPILAAAITAALDDPRLVDAFTNAIVRAHEALLGDEGAANVVLDTSDVTRAVRDAIAKYDEDLAALLSPEDALEVDLGNENLPTLGKARGSIHVVMLLGALAGVVLIGISLALDHSRKAIGRAGRRIVYLGLWPLALFGVLPIILDAQQAGVAEVGNAFLRAYGSRVLPVSIALTVIGGAVALGALAMRRTSVPVPATVPTVPHAAAAPGLQGTPMPSGPPLMKEPVQL
jgi:hypothetical protein